MNNGVPMTDSEIESLAREYAEELCCDETGAFNTDEVTYVMNIFTEGFRTCLERLTNSGTRFNK